MKTNRELTKKFPSNSKLKITIPKGTELKLVEGSGGGYAVKNDADLLKAGACAHDISHYYFFVPKDAIADLPADAVHQRHPLALKSENWQDTADHWRVDINGQKFDFYTGVGLRKGYKQGARYTLESLRAETRPQKPKLDDVLHSLVMDAEACNESFEEWCSNFGSNPDSIKALETYRDCQKNADKLRKAGINIEAERERLADY